MGKKEILELYHAYVRKVHLLEKEREVFRGIVIDSIKKHKIERQDGNALLELII